MKTLKIIGLIILASVAAWYLHEDYWYRKAVPMDIGLSYRISITSQSGLREGCGTAIYRLNDTTARSIQEKGLAFFEHARQARGHTSGYYAYGPWMETPIEDWTRLEDWSYDLLCGGKLDEALYREITDSSENPGSYYARQPEALLIVIPGKRLVVFTYNG